MSIDSRVLSDAALSSPGANGSGDGAEFYVTGGTLPVNAPSYVARQADHDLWNALQAGEFCYVLNTRQMGKSSLMVRTARRLRQAGTRVAVLDLTALGQNVTTDQWYDGLLSTLAEQLRLEDTMEEFWDENAKLGPLQRFITAIRQVALPRVPQPLVIFIDEIDAVRSLPFPVDELFAAIRECYNRRRMDAEYEKLTFCLLGVASPTDLIQDTRISPFNIGRRILLTDFTPAEAAPLAHRLPGGAPTLNRVLYWTDGHPYMTQRLCRTLAERGVTTAAGVDGVCGQLFLTKQARDTDDNLAFVRNRLLRSEGDIAALLDLYVRVRRGRRVKDDETNPLCAVLRLSGVAKSWGGFLRVRNRVYERVFDEEWARAHMPGAELRRQRAAYRRGLLRAGALASVVLLLMAALSGWALREAHRAAMSALRAQAAAQQAGEAAYDANMNLVQNNWYVGNIFQVQALLQKTQHDPDRGFEWGLWNWLFPHTSKLMTFTGHSGPIFSVAFSPDGKRIVTNSYENVVQTWNVRTGRFLLTLQPHGPFAKSVWDARHPAAWSPDGRRLVTGGSDDTARVWDADTGQALLTLQGHAKFVTSAAFSPDSHRIVTGSEDGTARVWDASTGKRLLTIRGNTGPIETAAWSPDGRRIVTGSDDGTVRVWDSSAGQALLTKTLHTINTPDGVVATVAFSPDGKRIVSGGDDGVVRVWDAHAWQPLGNVSVYPAYIQSVAFSPDGGRIVTGSTDDIVRVWNAWTGHVLLKLQGQGGPVTSVAFSPDGRRIASGGWDGTAKLWNADTEPMPGPQSLQGQDGPVISVAFSPDGRRIVTGNNDGIAKVCDARSGKALLRIWGHDGAVNNAVFSPDGKRIVTASEDGAAQIWDASPDQARPAKALLTKALHTITPYHGPVGAADFSPDGKRVVTGCEDGAVQVWEASTGRLLLPLLGHDGAVDDAIFSPDGRRIVTCGADGIIRVSEADTGRPLLRLQGHGGAVNDVVFSPDGRRIVASNMDGTAKVWDADTGELLLTLTGHGNAVDAVAYSPDGRRIVTGSFDWTAKVWDAKTGSALATITKTFAGLVSAVAFSPDGHSIVTGCSDGTAKVWFSDMNAAAAQPAPTGGKK